MIRNIVVSVSLGTGMMLIAMVLMICLSIALDKVIPGTQTQPVGGHRPKPGIVGEAQRTINDLKYGPVNLEAAKEVKNGGILSRIVQRRQTRSSAANQPNRYSNDHAEFCCNQPVASIPKSTVPIIDPTDCNFGYVVSGNPMVRVEATGISPVQKQPVDVPQITKPSLEYPAMELEESKNVDCPSCIQNGVESLFRRFSNPRIESKTGSFVCSNCRKACVGDEWHTDWSEDGTPVTFLCKRCYESMSTSQRIAAYRRYVSRQVSNNGTSALMHQEISK